GPDRPCRQGALRGEGRRPQPYRRARRGTVARGSGGLRVDLLLAREHLGDELARLIAVECLTLQLLEQPRVERDLLRAGYLDRRGGRFQGDGIVVEDPEADGGEGVPLDVGGDDA